MGNILLNKNLVKMLMVDIYHGRRDEKLDAKIKIVLDALEKIVEVVSGLRPMVG